MLYYRLLAFFFLVPIVAMAADWQYTGNSGSGKDKVAMFYDGDSIEHPNKDTVRMWVKSLSQKALTSHLLNHSTEKRYVEPIMNKLVTGYTPKFLLLPSIRRLYLNPKAGTLEDAIINITGEEFIANSGEIQETSKFYFEVDCRGRRITYLSATLFREDGSISKTTDVDYPTFTHIAPDSTGEGILLLACTSR